MNLCRKHAVDYQSKKIQLGTAQPKRFNVGKHGKYQVDVFSLTAFDSF